MNNTQFIAVIIGFVSLLLAVLGGAWLNQRGLEKQIEAFRAEMAARLDAQTAKLDALSERIGKIERQLEAIFKPVLPR